MKEELKEMFEYVQKLHEVSERWLKIMENPRDAKAEPAEEDTEFLHSIFHRS